MKASDLRLGNMVYFNGNHKHIGIVTSTQPKHIVQCCKYVEYSNDIKIGLNDRFDILYDVENIKPIPLTEEILLKCGFENIDNGWKVLDYDCFKISWERLAGLHLTFEDDGIYLPKIKNLHQLQNLYFALTGEELTVNL